VRVYQFRHIRRLVPAMVAGLLRVSGTIGSALFGSRVALLSAALALFAGGLVLPKSVAAAVPTPAGAEPVEVLVELAGAPAARSVQNRSGRVRTLQSSQRTLVRDLHAQIPLAKARWRYTHVLNAIAVTIPRRSLSALRELPGVVRVSAVVQYRSTLDASPSAIGAASPWRVGLTNLGEGLKIGIIDDGIDSKSPLFDPAGYAMPEGFPRGDARFTTEKVIVARTFPPSSLPVPAAALPFDRKRSQHATHVAGIAAGNAGVVPPGVIGRPRLPLSGVAPRAYIGNYRALTYPTESGVGLNGNSPEILAAIEAAVADGMDVINLSLGQPEVTPSRDLVARALDNAAAMGVVAVVAAGNDFVDLGAGSLASPGTSETAITVAATTAARAYGRTATLRDEPAAPVSETLAVALVPGSGAAALATMELTPLRPESVGTDPTLCTAPPAAELKPASVALATAEGCTLRVKAKNARIAGAASVLVAEDNSASYRASVKTSAIPIFLATSLDVAAVADAARNGAAPRLVIGSAPAVVPTTDSTRLASFSSAGPTPLSHRLKPDVAAPGVSIQSAFPVSDGSFGVLSGTSMAAPHVAGGAALLRELHPAWTPQEIKSALTSTGRNVREASGDATAPPSRVGGGLIDLVAAASPLVHTSPSSISFGLVRAPKTAIEPKRQIVVKDAGGGQGIWTVTNSSSRTTPGASIVLPATVEAPGTLRVGLRVSPHAKEGDISGWVGLSRGDEVRRIPYWARITRPRLPGSKTARLGKTGTYSANSRRAPARIDAYRYPERPTAGLFRGPEVAFSVTLDRALVNFGVAIIDQRSGVSVEPRIVVGRDENVLVGVSAFPFNGNPYQFGFGDRRLIAGALLPEAGRYTVVFDSRSRQTAGAFRFRFWRNDVTPPAIRVLGRQTRNGLIGARVRDRGSGVDPVSLSFSIDGSSWLPARWHKPTKRMLVDLSGLKPGLYAVRFRAADRQETKNWEYSGAVLPNTRVVTRQIKVVRDP
jgi:minor extracellular serine protease Vpr